MIDFSKVAVGDKVLIEATVKEVDGADSKYPLSVLDDYSGSMRWMPKAAIVSHIPRGPEVGDEVKIGDNGGHRFIVLGVDEEEAWVRRTQRDIGSRFGTCIIPLYDLTVTKRKSSI